MTLVITISAAAGFLAGSPAPVSPASRCSVCMETEYETYMRTRGGISNAQLSEEAAKAAWLARQSVPQWGSTAAGMSRADVENVVQRAVDHAVASGSPDPVGYVASLLSAEASKHSVDYSAVRRELLLMMDNPSWDDGSLAPIFIRLAWHSSGTYDAASGTGGSNGAGMRFEAEAADPENAGLHSARAFLEPVKRKFPGISYSDLWILAAYVGIEHTGGPRIAFRPGRVDYASEVELASYCCPQGGHGRLPAAEKYVSYDGVDAEGRPNGWQGLCMHIRNEVFYRMGFNDREIVALLCGGHVYGRCHPTSSGYAGAWVEHPTRWSNEYATDMLEDEWRLVDHSDTWLDAQGAAELRPAPGNRQYVNKCPFSVSDDANQMMLLSDMVLAWDPAFRAVLEEYAVDERRLSHDFAVAFKKLTELGCERVLQPEVAS